MADDDFDFFDTPRVCETPKLQFESGKDKVNGSDHEHDRAEKSSPVLSHNITASSYIKHSTTSKSSIKTESSGRHSPEDESPRTVHLHSDSFESDSEHMEKPHKLITHLPSAINNKHSSEYSSEYESDSSEDRSARSLKDVRRKEKTEKNVRPSNLTASEDDSLSVSDTESDVTDVSPLQSPKRRSNKYGLFTSGKPPKSPARFEDKWHKRSSDAGHSVSSDTFDQSEERMNLNILMQAVQEMEKYRRDDIEKNERIAKSRRVLVPKSSRKNYSFSNDRVMTIDKENQRLMQKIVKYARDAKKTTCTPRKPSKKSAAPKMTPSAVNRFKEQQRIERENLALLKRLQKAKPSREIKRDALLNEYEKKTIAGQSVAAAHRSSSGDNNYTVTMLNKRSYSMNQLDTEKATVVLRGREKLGNNTRSTSEIFIHGDEPTEVATVTLNSDLTNSGLHTENGQLGPHGEKAGIESRHVRHMGRRTVMATRQDLDSGW